MPSKQIVDQFIAQNNLRKADNSVIFNAQVSFYKGDTLHKLPSNIHIITLPTARVVYIDEFLNEGYRQPEIYSTDDYHFTHTESNVLQVKKFESQPEFLVSISGIG